jgi:hypothetical protein
MIPTAMMATENGGTAVGSFSLPLRRDDPLIIIQHHPTNGRAIGQWVGAAMGQSDDRNPEIVGPDEIFSWSDHTSVTVRRRRRLMTLRCLMWAGAIVVFVAFLLAVRTHQREFDRTKPPSHPTHQD